MRVREFWLTNSNSETYSLMGDVFGNDPEGLGYTVDLSTVVLGDTRLILDEQYNLENYSTELIFMGSNRGTIYQEYQKFLKFLTKKPIILHYRTPNESDSYRTQVRVISVNKTEMSEDHTMRVPVTMYRQTLWYSDTVNELEVSKSTATGKVYPLSRPYYYGELSLSNITVYNDGMTYAPLKVEIYGETTDASFRIYDSEGVLYGACKILGTYDYIGVDSNDINESIVLQRNGSNIPNAVNYQDLTVGDPQEVFVTFVKADVGTSKMVFSLDNDFSGYVKITWRNAYVSV